MLSGTPCMATDIGDSYHIINKLGWKIEKDFSNSIRQNIIDIIELKKNISFWDNLSEKCTKHIIDNYSIKQLIEKNIIAYGMVIKLWYLN